MISLTSIVLNKNLKKIGVGAFQDCRRLEDFQLPSSSISFGDLPFNRCDRLIEIADAAGFPSKTIDVGYRNVKVGDGVDPYLLNRIERTGRRTVVLVALMRFRDAAHAHDGTEKEKVATAKKHHPHPSSMPHPSCFTCKAKRRPTRMLKSCACNKAHFYNKQCQIDGWPKHKVACEDANARTGRRITVRIRC